MMFPRQAYLCQAQLLGTGQGCGGGDVRGVQSAVAGELCNVLARHYQPQWEERVASGANPATDAKHVWDTTKCVV